MKTVLWLLFDSGMRINELLNLYAEPTRSLTSFRFCVSTSVKKASRYCRVRFGGGVSFGGIDLAQYIGRDFQTEEQDGILVITGIY